MEKVRKKIVLVDDQITNLSIGRDVLAGQYDAFTVPSGEKLLLLLGKITPDLILLDIEMPGMNGYETLEKIKADPRTAHIPVIFLTARSDAGSEREGLALGAIDYISKPFSPPLLLRRIAVHLLVEAQRKELEQSRRLLSETARQKARAFLAVQDAVAQTVAELAGRQSGGPIGHTARYLEVLVDALLDRRLFADQTADWAVDQLLLAAQLYDWGALAGYDDARTAFCQKVLARIETNAQNQAFLAFAEPIVRYCHARWDGAGLPAGPSGADIPLPARLVALADAYATLLSGRPGQAPFPHALAVQSILEGRGTRFDPALVDLLIALGDRLADLPPPR